MLKKIISLVAVLLLAAALSQAAFAANAGVGVLNTYSGSENVDPDPGNDLRWTNVLYTTSNLSFENGKAKIYFYISGKSGTTYTNGTVKLKKIVGGSETTVATWSGLSGSSKNFTFSNNTVSVTSGTYKATLVIYAVRNGVSEKIELEATATY